MRSVSASERDESRGGGEEVGVDGGGEVGEAVCECGDGRGVEVLVGDAVDAVIADGAEMMPVALGDDAVEGDAVSGAAPGEEEDVGVGCGDGFGGGLGAGCADECASGCGDELGDPGLGVDEGLAPLFAVDGGFWLAGCGFLCGKDGLLEGLDEGFGFGGAVDLARDEAGVVEDVGEGVRGEREEGDAGFQDRGEGFETVGDGGYDEVGCDGCEFVGGGGPGVLEDGEVEGGEGGEGFEAVFGVGAEGVEAVEGGEG